MKRGVWLVVLLLFVVPVFSLPVDVSIFESKSGDALSDGGRCYMEWVHCSKYAAVGKTCLDKDTVRVGNHLCSDYGVVLSLPASTPYQLSVNVSNTHYGKNLYTIGAGLYIGRGSSAIGLSSVQCIQDPDAWARRDDGELFTHLRSGSGNFVSVCGGGEDAADRGVYNIKWNEKKFVVGVTLEDDLKHIGSLSSRFFNRSLSPDEVDSQGTKISVVDSVSKMIVEFYTVNTVADFPSDVLACVDYDLDGVCDYEENSCSSLNAYYKGLCCGEGVFASSKYYASNDATIPDAYCGKTEDGLFRWATQDHVAEVLDYRSDSTLNRSVVSDGTKRYVCGGTIHNSQTEQLLSSPVNINNHGFLCGDDRAIYECVSHASQYASGSRYAPRNNAVLPGESVVSGGVEFFCSRTGVWSSNLDASPLACVDAGFVWNGVGCCGEPVDDDTLEATFEGVGRDSLGVFAPVARVGACLNNSFVSAGSVLDSGKIINHDGKFFACGSSGLFSGTSVTPVSVDACGVPLLGVSLNLTPNAVCAPFGWHFTVESESTVVKDLAWESLLPVQGCCPVDKCWDGSSCKAVGEYFDIGRRGFRCEAE